MKTEKKIQLKNRDIEVGIKVLEREIEGLSALAASLDEKFSKLVELISNIKGRVIISGMGKSGHVARKIAATLASTGTPAMFVHPGEASHGDLGMITKNDVLILLSNSGETSELKDLIYYSRRFSIPLVAFVRRKTSILVDSADISLILPETPEANSVGAPTTSTTMMIALGDALAVALMERKSFDSENFQVFHPGGKLGKSFIKVEDIMKKGNDVPFVFEKTSVSETIEVINAKSLGSAVVVDDKKNIKGVITDGDLRRHIKDGFSKAIAKNKNSKKTGILELCAADIMTKNPLKIRKNALAIEAISIMNDKKITSLIVEENGKLAGVIHIHDVLRSGIT